MLVLISLIMFGILVALFATQNTEPVSVNIANYLFSGVPLYILVLLSMLTGIFMASLIHLFNGITNALTLHQKNQSVQDANRKAADLEERVHELEVENARLSGSEEPVVTENDTPKHPNLFDKLRKNFA